MALRHYKLMTKSIFKKKESVSKIFIKKENINRQSRQEINDNEKK